jgi:hypothetical protein
MVVYRTDNASPTKASVRLVFADRSTKKRLCWADTLTEEMNHEQLSHGHGSVFQVFVLSLHRPSFS